MATAKDPVCAMDVDTANPPGGRTVHAGQTYYFCSQHCLHAFEADPEKYLHGSTSAAGGHVAPAHH